MRVCRVFLNIYNTTVKGSLKLFELGGRRSHPEEALKQIGEISVLPENTQNCSMNTGNRMVRWSPWGAMLTIGIGLSTN